MEDSSYIMLNYDGVYASVHANYFYPGKEREAAVVGSEASFLCDFDAPEKKVQVFKNKHFNEKGVWKVQEGGVSAPEIPKGENLKLELGDFLNCVKSRRHPRADAFGGYRVVKILEAALESAQKGKTIIVEK